MRPLPAILTIIAAAAAGWCVGMLRPLPGREDSSASRPHARQKAVAADKCAAREAAADYLRVAEIRARKPRDFQAEWDADLDRWDLIPAWANADPDGFFAWFLEHGWRWWGSFDRQFKAALNGQAERLFLCVPQQDWRDRADFADIAMDLALQLPAEEAATLCARFSSWIGDVATISRFKSQRAFELLDAISRKMPAGRARDQLINLLTRQGAFFIDPQLTGKWWRSQNQHTKAMSAEFVIEGGYREDGPPPWDEVTFSDMVSHLGGSRAYGTLLSKWIRYLATVDPAAAARQAVATVRPMSVPIAMNGAWRDLLERAVSPADLTPVLEVLSIEAIRRLLGGSLPPTLLHNVVLPLLEAGPGTQGYDFAAEAVKSYADQPEVADWIRECREPLPADLIDRVAVNLPGGYRDKLAWIQSLEGQPVRQAVADLAGLWFVEDPAGAAAALGVLPAGTLRHAAIQKASVWLGEEPAAAREWLATLPASDRPAVVMAVQDSGLDSIVKQEILTPPGDPSPGAEK